MVRAQGGWEAKAKGEKRKHSDVEHINVMEMVENRLRALESNASKANNELLQVLKEMRKGGPYEKPEKSSRGEGCFRCKDPGHLAAQCTAKLCVLQGTRPHSGTVSKVERNNL